MFIFTSFFTVKLSESLSDKCMTELTGELGTDKRCVISSECIEIMTVKGLTGYGITHQILWTMLADQVSPCKIPKCWKLL